MNSRRDALRHDPAETDDNRLLIRRDEVNSRKRISG